MLIPPDEELVLLDPFEVVESLNVDVAVVLLSVDGLSLEGDGYLDSVGSFDDDRFWDDDDWVTSRDVDRFWADDVRLRSTGSALRLREDLSDGSTLRLRDDLSDVLFLLGSALRLRGAFFIGDTLRLPRLLRSGSALMLRP